MQSCALSDPDAQGVPAAGTASNGGKALRTRRGFEHQQLLDLGRQKQESQPKTRRSSARSTAATSGTTLTAFAKIWIGGINAADHRTPSARLPQRQTCLRCKQVTFSFEAPFADPRFTRQAGFGFRVAAFWATGFSRFRNTFANFRGNGILRSGVAAVFAWNGGDENSFYQVDKIRVCCVCWNKNREVIPENCSTGFRGCWHDAKVALQAWNLCRHNMVGRLCAERRRLVPPRLRVRDLSRIAVLDQRPTEATSERIESYSKFSTGAQKNIAP